MNSFAISSRSSVLLTIPDPIADEEKKLTWIFIFALLSSKGLHKTFWVTSKKCENKSLRLIFSLTQLCQMHGAEGIKSPILYNIYEQFVLTRGNFKCKVVGEKKLSHHRSSFLILNFILSSSRNTEKHVESAISYRDEWSLLLF